MRRQKYIEGKVSGIVRGA